MATWTLAALQARRGELIALAASHGASNLRVFGSVARGSATPTSDVDILVDFEPPGRDWITKIALGFAVQKVLDCRVDVVELPGKEVDSLVGKSILKDAIPL